MARLKTGTAAVGVATPNSARVLRDNRRAVIDAATAVEVALAYALRTRLGEMPEDALEATIRSANGLVGLLKLVEQIDSTEKSRWKRVADRLANPRNSCVHRGIKLTREELQSAIEEAHTLLETYSPLPKLTELRLWIRSATVFLGILMDWLWPVF